MTQLLVYREQIQKFYQKYSFLFNPVFRFLIGYITFSSINRMIGYHPYLHHLYIEIIFGILGIFLPGNVMLFFAVIFTVGHIFYVSPMLALVTGMIFAILYFAYLKFVPEQAYVVIAFPILFSLHLVYVLPILLGLTMTPIALIPIICGVGTYYLLQAITSVVSTSSDVNTNLYHVVMEQFFGTEEMYVLLVVFFVVSLIVYILRNREWDYVFEKAIVTGGVTNIILLLLVNFIFDLNMDVVQIFVGSLFAVLIVIVIQFMRLTLNYASVEHLQFEDEEYYYYVRAVPKANVAAPSKRIKRFSVRSFGENGSETSKRHAKKNVTRQETSTSDSDRAKHPVENPDAREMDKNPERKDRR